MVAKLTGQLADAEKAVAAAQGLAAKDGFWANFKKSAGLATGAGAIGLIGVGVPSAAVYFMGAEHPVVRSFLTVLGRLPK